MGAEPGVLTRSMVKKNPLWRPPLGPLALFPLLQSVAGYHNVLIRITPAQNGIGTFCFVQLRLPLSLSLRRSAFLSLDRFQTCDDGLSS